MRDIPLFAAIVKDSSKIFAVEPSEAHPALQEEFGAQLQFNLKFNYILLVLHPENMVC